jgi:hypothetical protein
MKNVMKANINYNQNLQNRMLGNQKQRHEIVIEEPIPESLRAP